MDRQGRPEGLQGATQAPIAAALEVETVLLNRDFFFGLWCIGTHHRLHLLFLGKILHALGRHDFLRTIFRLIGLSSAHKRLLGEFSLAHTDLLFNALRRGGFSFGGLVAGHMLGEGAPIQSLKLVGSAGMGMRPEAPIDMLLWQRARNPEQLLEAYKHNLRALMLHRDEQIDELALAIHAECCRQTRWRSREASHQAKLREIIQQTKVPVHALWGLQDPTIDPLRLEAWWGEHMRDKGAGLQSLTLWEDCGHWIMHQLPVDLAAWFKTHA
ncbi:MAG: alpha/beta hydrolase [Betaproteobacteria bacterium]|nr:alpha/beta hydrolase [Betaproteobacteria bacterium]